MKSTYKYSLGSANRHKDIIKIIKDYKFEKNAEISINSSLQDSVDTLNRQINTLNARNYEFEEYSFLYLNSNIITIEEALLLMIGFNPDVLSNKNFHQFNLSNNSIGLLEALFIHRVNEYNILERNVFSGQSQVKTDQFIKFAISNNYFSRTLSTPKTATYKNKIKNQNLLITKEGLIELLKASKKPRNKSYHAARLYERIKDKLLPYNSSGDTPKINTIRRYVSEITLTDEWSLMPSSIKNQIKR